MLHQCENANQDIVNHYQSGKGAVMDKKLIIGLSACLAGEKVRFDGGHRKDATLLEEMGKCFEFRTFCPEVAIGMSTPREPIRLVTSSAGIQAVGTRDNRYNVTEPLKQITAKQKAWLQTLSGYVVKKGSPSCGMERVKVYSENRGSPTGMGLFTEQLIQLFPLLPVEEEGRLKNPVLLDSFIQRIYAYHRWNELDKSGITAHKLINFHMQYKMILLSRCQKIYRELGRLIATVTRDNISVIAKQYINILMETLKKPATRGGHFNVLQHLFGFLKNHLPYEEKQQLLYTTEKYRIGELPLIAPLILLNMYFTRHKHRFIENTLYLKPYPIELGIYKKL